MFKARLCVREMGGYESPSSEGALDLRLDLNESTTGCSPRVLARMRSLDAKALALYPPRAPGEKVMADFLGLRPEQVMLTNGADEGIDLLCRAYLDSGDEVIVVAPAFSMYQIFSRAAGAKVVAVASGPEFRFPLEQILLALTPRTRMVVVTNPNNPTGVLVDRDAILRILEAAPDAAVLVDEAYYDFCGETMIDQVGRIPNLLVARTFSKAYGLAGLRLGVLAAAEEPISCLRRICSPFNVNAFALACLEEALDDRQFVAHYAAQVRATREWMRRELQGLGFPCGPSHANFVFVNFGEFRGAVLAGMRERGIALRDRPDCPGWVRISVGTQAEMERVVAALRRILSAASS